MALPQQRADAINYSPPPTIGRFIRSHRPGELFYDWICGPVGCLPADSEYLTPAGWKRMDAYTPGDEVAVWSESGVLFEAAEYVDLPSPEPFHTFDSGSLVMELSPEHKVLYEDYRGRMQTCTAAHMAEHPSRRTIPTTFNLKRTPTPMSDAEIRWRVAFSADGHIPAAGQQVRVVLRKERKKSRLRQIMQDFNLEWIEKVYPGRPTETQFHVYWGEPDKSLDFVWGLSTAQLRAVVDECTRWDGLNEHTEKRYYSTDRKHADAIQFAAHATGYRATIKAVDDPRNPAWATMYTVSIRTADNAKNTAAVREHTQVGLRAAPDGRKYCFHTSTGFFVARCNGTVFITGNSGKTTSIFFKLIYMAQLQEPGRDGIRRSRAVVVRNTLPQLRDTTLSSWDYWFKDGQAGKWYATKNSFLLKYGDVECEVLFRPLDTPDDVARVLSLEVTFAILDEYVQIPREIVDALSARLGRYPAANDGGATNWGMWGASNPDTEDNWWYDYLHNALPENATYFVQPSGFSDKAENVENLPGGVDYYHNQAKGKTEGWIKQFIEAEWGYSAAGKPVVPSYNKGLHLAPKPVRFDETLPLVAGFDPGIGGSAMIFGQEDLHGRLRVLGELVQEGMGAERFIQERLRPFLRLRFPGAALIIAPDPAASGRAQSDETTVVQVFRKHFDVRVESNNRLPLRLVAIEHYTSRLTDVGPALLIDEAQCPTLTRALGGGWRYALDRKYGTIKGAEPEKNAYSHPGDAFGYLCRFFHRQSQRDGRYGTMGAKKFTPPQQFGPAYHFR